MIPITAEMVARLREESGETMMDCKKALVEFKDFDKALDYLKNTPVHVRYRSRTDWHCNCCECQARRTPRWK